MAQHATYAQLVAMWPGEGTPDEGRAKALLPLVSAAVDAECRHAGVDVMDAGEDVLALVTCQATSRMLMAQQTGFGVTQESWGASPYSGSQTFANPTGDIYFTSAEKRLLGEDEGTCGYVMPQMPE